MPIAKTHPSHEGLRIRDAGEDDAPAIQEIYAHYVLHSFVTFEEIPPTTEQALTRRASVLEAGLPYLAAEIDGCVVGYAYAAPFHSRSGYRHTIEDSIYVRDGLCGKGVGRALLSALIARCEAGPQRQMVAVIGDTANAASIALHRRMGFRPAGTLDAVGFKFGRWIDVVFMQRALGDGAANLPADRSRET